MLETIHVIFSESRYFKFQYPRSLLDEKYDNEFAIRGLHFDVQTSCLLKVDAFSQIQGGQFKIIFYPIISILII